MSFPCQILKPATPNKFGTAAMPRTFVTFGMNHYHNINGQILNGDTVAVLDCESADHGRERAFDLFGPKFSMEYHEREWNECNIKLFPKGYIYLYENS